MIDTSVDMAKCFTNIRNEYDFMKHKIVRKLHIHENICFLFEFVAEYSDLKFKFRISLCI